jgi:hypothetical protein
VPVEFPRRGGDLARPSLDVEPRTSCLALADAAKGDDEAPNTARLVDDDGEEGSFGVAVNGEDAAVLLTGALATKGIDDVAFFDAKRLSPLTEANGELVDAYAMKPV